MTAINVRKDGASRKGENIRKNISVWLYEAAYISRSCHITADGKNMIVKVKAIAKAARETVVKTAAHSPILYVIWLVFIVSLLSIFGIQLTACRLTSY
jgi:hypothetical protein